MSEHNAHWRPSNGPTGERAHAAFQDYLEEIGFQRGEVELPTDRRGQTHGVTGPIPDGYTPSGNPIELKSEHKVDGKAARGQILKALAALPEATHGEIWVWIPDEDGFRFEPRWKVLRDGVYGRIYE